MAGAAPKDPTNSPKDARASFSQGDASASRGAHEASAVLRQSLEPAHEDSRCFGDFSLKPLIFGGLDGINTTFAVIAGATGAGLSMAHILIMGFVGLFAGAFSMGLGEWNSSKAELEFYKWERDREAWETENYPEGEVLEMIDIYKGKGMSEEDAKIIMTTMSKYTDIFVDHMMVEELGLMPPAPNKDPRADGLVMFAAFSLLGVVPLLSFMVEIGQADRPNTANAFNISCVLTTIALIILGYGQAKYRKRSTVRTCLKMLFNGFISFAVAYGTGRYLNNLFTNGQNGFHLPSSTERLTRADL